MAQNVKSLVGFRFKFFDYTFDVFSRIWRQKDIRVLGRRHGREVVGLASGRSDYTASMATNLVP